ncbi:hypothetical protein [Planktotalea sp.]|uniref:hypothetical protein n=1 Tax=Planktotalea sp. TaxID=2029877 RepID=UPI003299A360
MSAPYHYKAFGLNILSDFAVRTLPDMPKATPDARIQIRDIGKPFEASSVTVGKRDWQADGEKLLLDIPDIARFLIAKGKEIWIESAPSADAQDIEAYLIGSAFAALLQQRELLTLHASAIETPKGAVLFLGKSGAGKSTLLSAMLTRGYAMISDDISALQFDGSETPKVLPAFPTRRLTKKAMSFFDIASGGLTPMRADKDKYLVPAPLFCEHPRPLHRAYLLHPQDGSPIDVRDLSAAEQFQYLTRFTFRRNYYKGLGLEAFSFQAVTTLAKNNSLTKIVRPTDTLEIHELADRVEQDLL